MKARDLTTAAFMTSLLVISSHLAIPVGPVPLTLQTLVVFLIGFLLSPKNAFLSTFLFLILGLIGLPVFSGFSGGLQSIFTPSFGFILSFIPASYFQARYLTHKTDPGFKTLIAAGFINIIITQTIGLLYMAFILNFYLGNNMGIWAVLATGLTFLPGDFLKLTFAILLAKRVRPLLLQKAYKKDVQN